MDESKMDRVHVIDIKKLVSSTTKKLKPECSGGDIQERKGTEFPLIPMLNHHYCYKDKEVYKPPVITIGPYHYHINNTTTIDVEKLKWDALSYILRINPKIKMRDYILGLEELEQQIRSCYAYEIRTSRDKFLKTIFVDGCFVLYALCGPEGVFPMELNNWGLDIHTKPNMKRDAGDIEDDSEDHNTCYARKWYTVFFSQDLLLLENQIPFFVVKRIYKLGSAGRDGSTSLLIENIASSIEYLIYPFPKTVMKLDAHNEFHHLLHLCHMFFKPGQVIGDNDQDYLMPVSDQLHRAFQELPKWHRASEYHKGGINFRKRETHTDDPHSLLDIRYCDGVLEMRRLTIDTNTHRLFQNLLAFEQTSPQVGNYMTTYVVFLSRLVSEPEDVSLLAKRGIILHELESDGEVSEVFRMLAEGVDFNLNCNHYLESLCSRMEGYCQIRRSRWRGWLWGSITSSIPTLTSGNSSESDQFPEELSAEQHV